MKNRLSVSEGRANPETLCCGGFQRTTLSVLSGDGNVFESMGKLMEPLSRDYLQNGGATV